MKLPMVRWLFRTLQQMRGGGAGTFLRKAKRLYHLFIDTVVWMLMAPFVVVVIFIARVLRPWVLMRFGFIRSDKIGHFGIDASLHLARQKLRSGKPLVLDFFYFPRKTCNDQLARMVRRELLVFWWVRYLVAFNRIIPGGEFHKPDSINISRDIHGLFSQTDASFAFAPEENQRAKGWLKKHGWIENTPFVCLLVRDEMYTSIGSDRDWSYHTFRDSDIDTYNSCIEKLVDDGYWVIRMGKVMQNELSFTHPHVIDYPFVDDQDDLLDIWLSANCRFFVTTGTGVDAIADACGLPTIYVNYNPLLLLKAYSNVLIYPKHLIWKETGKYLTLRDHLEHPYLHTSKYEAAGITIKDLSGDEILLAVDEMEQRVAGTWQDTDEDRNRQNNFWAIFKAYLQEHPNPYQGWINPQAKVSACWLRSMGDDFLA